MGSADGFVVTLCTMGSADGFVVTLCTMGSASGCVVTLCTMGSTGVWAITASALVIRVSTFSFCPDWRGLEFDIWERLTSRKLLYQTINKEKKNKRMEKGANCNFLLGKHTKGRKPSSWTHLLWPRTFDRCTQRDTHTWVNPQELYSCLHLDTENSYTDHVRRWAHRALL